MSWYPGVTLGRINEVRGLPKIDLHRHLEGSLRMSTLREIAAQYNLHLPDGDLAANVQMQPWDTLTYSTFLSKFVSLRQFYRSPEIIQRVTRDAVEDAARDGVVYLELRFTPVALGRLRGYPLADVIDWVADSAAEAARDFGIQVRLIASVNRHEPFALAEEVAALAAGRTGKGIVALDLAGNEAEFPALPFAGLFREARESGLHLTVHAGEWAGPANVREAIEVFQAERIGHGVRVMQDPIVVDLARERGTVFEVCVTSNVQSGVVQALADHPLPRMLASGLNVTINTDDPSISGITLSDELVVVQDVLKVSDHHLWQCILGGVDAAFLPVSLKADLAKRVKDPIPIVMA